MKRRHLLHTFATLPLLSNRFACLAAPTKAAQTSAPRTIRRVRPSNPLWPNKASWAKLREAVDGNLIEVRALFEPCVAEPDGAACREASEYVKYNCA